MMYETLHIFQKQKGGIVMSKRKPLKCVYPDPDTCKYYNASNGTCRDKNIACSYRMKTQSKKTSK